MPRNEDLGKLEVNLEADTSDLKSGMRSAQSILRKSVKGMQSIVSKMRTTLLGLGVVAVAAFGRLGYGFLDQQKKMAVLEHTYKNFAGSAKRSFKEVERGMLKLAKTTGLSTADQAGALQVLTKFLDGVASESEITEVLLPIAIDWAVVNDKDLPEAAKDIAESYLGEAPEEIMMPVRIKWEEANPGQAFDDLTRQEKWKQIERYLKQFEGSAEAAADTLWGAFGRITTAVQELFNAMSESAEFQPIIDQINNFSDSIFDLAIRIKDGDIPDNLQGIIDGINNLLPKITEFLSTLTWEKIEKFGNTLKNVALGIAGFTVAEKVTPLIRGLSGAIKSLALAFGALSISSLAGKIFTKIAPKPGEVKWFTGTMGKMRMALIQFTGNLKSGGGIIKSFGMLFSGVAKSIGMTSLGLAATFATLTGVIIAFVLAWKNNWGELRDRTREAWTDVKNTFQGIWNRSIKPLIDEIWGSMEEFAGMFGIELPKIPELFDDMWKKTERILGGLKNSIGNAFAIIIETFSFLLKTIGNIIGVIVETIRGFYITVESILKTLYYVITGQFDKIGGVWDDWYKTIKNISGNILTYLGNFVGDFIQWLFNLVDGGWDFFANFFGFFGDFQVDLVSKGRDINQSIRSWVGEAVDEFMNFSVRIDEIFSSIGDFLFGWIPGTLEVVKDKMITTTGTIKTSTVNKLGELKTGISNVFGDIGSFLFGWIPDTLDRVKTNMSNKFIELKDDVTGSVSDLLTNLRRKFRYITSEITDTTSIIEGKLSTLWGKFRRAKNKILGYIEDIKDGLRDKFASIKRTMSNLADDILEPITDMKWRFVRAGRGLISALWSGVRGKFDDFSDWFEGKLDWVRDLLPGSDAKRGPLSTLTNAGRGLFSAMQDGMAKEAPNFLRGVEGIAAQTKNMLPSNMDMSAKKLATANGGYQGRQKQVVVQVNGGVYTNERDFDKLATKVNEKMGRDYRR